MSDYLDRLSQLGKKSVRRVAGVMSGTSMNGIDVAICQIGGLNKKPRVLVEHFGSFAYSRRVRELLDKSSILKVAEISELNMSLGAEFARAVLTLLKRHRMSPRRLDLIGSHGQTVFHHSGGAGIKSSLQVGDGDVISAKLGIPVFSDFRVKDIANGGEGAPLTPYADYWFFGPDPKVVVNLGGIANVTVITKKIETVLGFDSGPANAPLDRAAYLLSKGKLRFDDLGNIARRGEVNQRVLKILLAQDGFLKRRPPKSTGTEVYGDAFVQRVIKLHGRMSADVLSTLTEFVAISITRAIKAAVGATPKEVLVAGGGVRNLYLLERITAHLIPAEVQLSDVYGINAEVRESAAFALLANDALLGVATSLPKATGAKKPCILGKLSLP